MSIPINYVIRPARNTANIIFQNNLEGSSPLSLWNSLEQVNTGVNITVSSDFSYGGTYSQKHICNKADGEVNSGYRAEVDGSIESSNNVERWIGFSVYIPASYVTDLEAEVIFQYHDYQTGGSGHSPPFSLAIGNGQFYIIILSSPVVNATTGIYAGYHPLGNYTAGQWYNFVFHIRFAYDNTGLVESWVNGQRPISPIIGPNNYNNTTGNYPKFGIYKYRWKESPDFSVVTSRTLYFDNFIIGNQNATYNDVAP